MLPSTTPVVQTRLHQIANQPPKRYRSITLLHPIPIPIATPIPRSSFTVTFTWIEVRVRTRGAHQSPHRSSFHRPFVSGVHRLTQQPHVPSTFVSVSGRPYGSQLIALGASCILIAILIPCHAFHSVLLIKETWNLRVWEYLGPWTLAVPYLELFLSASAPSGSSLSSVFSFSISMNPSLLPIAPHGGMVSSFLIISPEPQ